MLAEKDDEISRLRESLVAAEAKAVDLAHELALAEAKNSRADDELRRGSALLSKRIREIGDAVYRGLAGESVDDLFALADELKNPQTVAIPEGAAEWIARQYVNVGEDVVVRALFEIGTHSHRLTVLEYTVGGGEPQPAIVAQDTGESHSTEPAISAPMGYSELVHLMTNVTAEELVTIGARVNAEGKPFCPRAKHPTPDGEPLGFSTVRNWPEIERRAHEVIVQWAIGESLKDPPAAEGLSDAIEALKEALPRDAFEAEAERRVAEGRRA